jgi:excisionase family DNA binding protein
MPRRPPVSRILNDVPALPADAVREAAQTIGTADAAARLGVTTAAVRQAIHDGRLPAVFRRGRWWLRPADVAAYRVGGHRSGPRPPGS